MFRKTTIVAMLGAALLIGGALPAVADSPRECRERIRIAEHNLREAKERYGERSREAEKRRRELERVRERCRQFEDDKSFHHENPH
ncbi:MAG: hypothetical protein ABSD88_04310 [Candidatus Korobacteraceae bacterium]